MSSCLSSFFFLIWQVPYPGNLTDAWDNVHVLNPELFSEAKLLAGTKKKVPLSGLNGVLIAMHLCSLPVSMVGFRFSTDIFAPSHYYGTWPNTKEAVLSHELDHQKIFFDRLIAMGFLKDLMTGEA